MAYRIVSPALNASQHFSQALTRSQRNHLRVLLESPRHVRQLKQALGLHMPGPTPHARPDARTARAPEEFTCPACMGNNNRLDLDEGQQRCGKCGAFHSTEVLLTDGWTL